MNDRNSVNYVFKRAEKKYLLSRDKYISLLERIKEYFEPDVNSGFKLTHF